MTNTITLKCLLFLAFLLFTMGINAQELLDINEGLTEDAPYESLLRPKNSVSLGAGSALINGEISTPDYENSFKLQLNRFITQSIVISGNIKKFGIQDYGFKEIGFLSGDVNAEWYVLPNRKFTPIVYTGPGLLVSNNFKDENYKVQGGIGLEYLLHQNWAVVGSLEANYIFDEQVNSQLLEEANSVYYNASIGIQFYFGNRTTSTQRKPRGTISNVKPTVINSNLIGTN